MVVIATHDSSPFSLGTPHGGKVYKISVSRSEYQAKVGAWELRLAELEGLYHRCRPDESGQHRLRYQRTF